MAKALEKIRAKLIARANALRARLQDDSDTMCTERSSDVVDQAFDTGSSEVNSQLCEQAASEFEQIAAALARITAGTYGICEDCQHKIPVARLEALPYTTSCVKCQSQHESDRGDFDADDVATDDDD